MSRAAPPLPGFDSFLFEAGGTSRTVYRRGEGPGVLLMHELTGMTPEAVKLGEHLAAEGFTVYMPLLFGEPGRKIRSPLFQLLRLCVRREIYLLAARKSSPITDWLRALARRAHGECGGPGVGAVGMCLTGNFALSLMVDETLMAPVLSQPALPLYPLGRKDALALSPDELERCKERARGGLPVLGLRFTCDRVSPGERFERLGRELGLRKDGGAFEPIEIDSSPGNPHGIPENAHSVLTKELVDREGHPTHTARARVTAFLREQLSPPEPTAAAGAALP